MREVAGELVLMDLAAEKYFSLNSSGSVVWSALADGATRSEVAMRVAEAFGIELATAEEDASELIATLLDAGLIVESA